MNYSKSAGELNFNALLEAYSDFHNPEKDKMTDVLSSNGKPVVWQTPFLCL